MKRKGTTNAELKSIMERDVLGNAGTEFEKTTMSIESNGTENYSMYFEPNFYGNRLDKINKKRHVIKA